MIGLLFGKLCVFTKHIIHFCNSNDGFISAILAIVAIYLSIVLARFPYQKKVKFYHYNDQDKRTNEIITHVFVSNVGHCPVYVDSLIAREGYIKEIGQCMEIQSTILSDRLLEPQQTREFRIRLNGYKPTSVGKCKRLRVVLKSGVKRFRYRANWAMG